MVTRFDFWNVKLSGRALAALLACTLALLMAWPAAAQSPDGVEDTDFPTDYWALTYYEGRDGTPGSTSWGNPANGSGGTGTKQFRGEAFFGIGSNDVTITSNGSASFNRWSNTETPTSPNLHHPSYVGSVWTGSNPHYQIDARRSVQQSGTLTFGFGANEVVDDVIDVYVNGIRVYAYFPSGGAPDPRPGQGVGATINLNAGDEILIRFINLGFIGGYTFRFQTPPLLGVEATNDTASGISGVIGGTNVLNVLSNDQVNGSQATPTNSTLSVVGPISSRLNFNTATGQVSVLPGTPTGTYSFTYQICETGNPSNCDTAIASINVTVPVSNGQSCPAGQGNLLLNPNFSSGFANWSQTGANANSLNLRTYTGNPSGTAFSNVVVEDANNTSGTLSQFVPRSISRSGDGILRFDYAWNNGSPGNGTTIIVSVAGIDVMQLASDNTNNNTTPADFTFLNGASGSVGGETFGVNATGKLPITQYFAWDLYGISINLPAGLTDSGDVEFRYTNQTDDWAIDNVILCNILISDVEVTKTSSTFTPTDFYIPGSDVIYAINVQNTGDLDIDADTVFVVDTLPGDLTFFNGDYNGAAPGTNVVGFTQSNSSLTFSEASDLAFSSQVAAPTSFAQCTYTPTSGYDSNVRHICINPKGVFETGPAPPEFTLEFRARIN